MPGFGSALSLFQMAGSSGVSGNSLLYPKSDGRWYTKNGVGSEIAVGGAPFSANNLGLRASGSDVALFSGTTFTPLIPNVAYSAGNMYYTSTFGTYFVTIPTAGVYTFAANIMYTSNTTRRQLLIETWTGSTPAIGSGRVFALDDRYLGSYSALTIRATEPMAAGQCVRLLGYVDSGTNSIMNSFFPTRLDIRRIL